MKNLETTIEEICKIIPMTESQKQDVRIQIYDLIVHLNRPISVADQMDIEEITDTGDGFWYKIKSDNPIYNEMLKQGGGDEQNY